MEENTKVEENEADILKIPKEVLARVFRFLTFAQISQCRSVCRRFMDVSASVLGAEFKRLSSRIQHHFQWTNLQLLTAETVERKLEVLRFQNVLRFLNSELTILRAIYWRYVERNGCFFAGKILDEFDEILAKASIGSASLPEKSNRLFVLNTKLILFLESKLEPSMQETPFGVKVVDILTCSSNSDYDLTLSTDNHVCHLEGVFDIVNINGLTAPPEFEDPSRYPDSYKLRSFNKYLRNIVRWNNVFQSLKKLWRLEEKVKSGVELTPSDLQDVPPECLSTQVDSSSNQHFRKKISGNSHTHLFRCQVSLTCDDDCIPVNLDSNSVFFPDSTHSISSERLLRPNLRDDECYNFSMVLEVYFRPFLNLSQFRITVHLNHTASTLTISNEKREA